jgi:hypothetical protein
VILGAEVDLQAMTVLISGSNLGETEPLVTLFVPTLGEVELLILDYDPVNQEILAELPDGIENLPGTFLLTVSRGPRASDIFHVAVGVAAPRIRVVVNETSPNITMGHRFNGVGEGVVGAIVGGGGRADNPNQVLADYGVVGGGRLNTASGKWSTVSGGISNEASGDGANLGGGSFSTASGHGATVAGGGSNEASGISSAIGGGAFNVASGFRSTVPGGDHNTAQGDLSLAAGRRAKALHNGSFVWGDNTNADMNSTSANTFTARASGGVRFYSNGAATTGVYLPPGAGAWSMISDQQLKENLTQVNGKEVLERLKSIPVSYWNYSAQSTDIRHIGPTAQDFYAALSVGENNQHISTVDAHGVALAAIQGLLEVLNEQAAQVKTLREEVAQLRESKH